QAVHACPTEPAAGHHGGRGAPADDHAARNAQGGRCVARALRMIPRRVVLATTNPGKVRELSALLREGGDVEVVPLASFSHVEMPAEPGSAYLENAAAKARAVADATGLPALADDSGIEVDALGGAPGIRSARYAASDQARNAKLLAALRDVPEAARSARYRCV